MFLKSISIHDVQLWAIASTSNFEMKQWLQNKQRLWTILSIHYIDCKFFPHEGKIPPKVATYPHHLYASRNSDFFYPIFNDSVKYSAYNMYFFLPKTIFTIMSIFVVHNYNFIYSLIIILKLYIH